FWHTEVEEIRPRSVILRDNVARTTRELPNDAIYAMIGYRPDVRLLDVCGVLYDPETLIPVHDPATFETNVSGLFIAGSVACRCKTCDIFRVDGSEDAGRIAAGIGGR